MFLTEHRLPYYRKAGNDYNVVAWKMFDCEYGSMLTVILK